MLPIQMENGSPGDFFNPFTICSTCKQKFFIWPFIYEEPNGIYPFPSRLNGLNRLNGLAHLWILAST